MTLANTNCLLQKYLSPFHVKSTANKLLNVYNKSAQSMTSYSEM